MSCTAIVAVVAVLVVAPRGLVTRFFNQLYLKYPSSIWIRPLETDSMQRDHRFGNASIAGMAMLMAVMLSGAARGEDYGPGNAAAALQQLSRWRCSLNLGCPISADAYAALTGLSAATATRSTGSPGCWSALMASRATCGQRPVGMARPPSRVMSRRRWN